MADKKLGFAETFALSGASAIVSKTATAPLERVKLLIQNQGEIIKSGRLREPYKGFIDCTTRIFRTEGLWSFWRGNFTHCLLIVPSYALQFAFKDHVQRVFKVEKNESYVKRFGMNVMSDGVAGALTISILYSLDYARERLANDVKVSGKGGAERQFNGLIDVYRKTLKSDGVVGLYRGFVVSCVGIMVYRGCYFGFYDTLKPIVLGENASPSASFGLGYIVTVCAGLLSYPLTTIRRRMMMRSCEAVKYKGSIDCGLQILRNEGFLSLMKGAGITIVSAIAGACILSGYDKFKQYYIKWRVST